MRQAIVDAAIHCFAARGYATTTNREIAAFAGVTSSLLYHYFDDKAALFRAAVMDVNLKLLDLYRASALEAPDAPSMQQLSLGVERAIEFAGQRPEVMRFAGLAVGEILRHPELRISRDEGSEAFPMLFRELLERAHRRGELDPDVDIDAGVRVLSACMTRLAGMHGEVASHEEFARSMRTFERMLRGGLMRVPPSVT
ncbi:hypothetical protein M622_04435 [Thauera terpenica 58Eu]|uniref:HTH tetR-type domain-containing protein n=1 Tax=Thauera terpenica 58Eu TaxID=1348657 RepID=T0AVV7_9RHOO|nr:TetR/AcrR family transcriptional regulator [Thauera terpenica]EPZ14703.1 hypothetical protein M622_04435 [Thauera terpenica 58Eu]